MRRVKRAPVTSASRKGAEWRRNRRIGTGLARADDHPPQYAGGAGARKPSCLNLLTGTAIINRLKGRSSTIPARCRPSSALLRGPEAHGLVRLVQLAGLLAELLPEPGRVLEELAGPKGAYGSSLLPRRGRCGATRWSPRASRGSVGSPCRLHGRDARRGRIREPDRPGPNPSVASSSVRRERHVRLRLVRLARRLDQRREQGVPGRAGYAALELGRGQGNRLPTPAAWRR